MATASRGAQPARQQNIDAIAAYYKEGIKPADAPGQLGVELEHIVTNDDLTPVSYLDDYGVEWLLGQLKDGYPEAYYEDGHLFGLTKPQEAISLEPAAQFELSAGPYEQIGEIRYEFELFQRRIAKILGAHGKRLLSTGYHPTAKATDLQLIPKERYYYMNKYLGAISPCGPQMMRGSAATQVSIDYYSVEDCLRKLRLAYALVPVLSLMCDNSPVFEGAPRPHQLMRTYLWRYCDPDRCGVVKGVMDPGFTLEHYAEYVLDTPAILVPGPDHTWIGDDRTFGDIYAETPMSTAEIEHALSMFFTDVRLKRYIEIRPADAMPVPYVVAYAALIKGLFYSKANLDAMDELFAGVTEADIDDAKTALMDSGYEAQVYGRPVAEIADAIVKLARDALESNERNYLTALEQLVRTRKTLALMASR